MKKNKHTVTGVFVGNARGFGFVTQEAEDIFIPPSETGNALHGDTVACLLTSRANHISGQRVEGRIIEVLTRGRASMVGTFHTEAGRAARRGGAGFIVPLDAKIPYRFRVTTAERKTLALADGHRVVFQTPPKKVEPDGARVSVKEVLGHANDPGVDVLSLVEQYGIPYIFPEGALQEAAALPDTVDEADTAGRLDLRGTDIITIDGDDTKDIDDAVHLTVTPDGLYELGVHIADVTHYVREGMPLDTEALRRGTSVYPVDRVIPMLPHSLSNGICSLNENEDRLAVSCIMMVDGQGCVLSHQLTPSVIRSRKRFTYNRVYELLTADEKPVGENDYDDVSFLPMLQAMNRLRMILRDKRLKRGALTFNFPEAKIRLDEDGRPISVEAYEHNAATGIIEEFMILCNETVAERFFAQKTPFVYRAHEEPEPDKLRQLAEFTHSVGYPLRGVNAAAVQRLLVRAEGTPEEYIIGQAVLRSLKQARYDMNEPFHYGLAAPYYCHFTSPIRRYPDLQVHRIVKQSLHTGGQGFDPAHYKSILPDVCARCSQTERNAEALEREAEQLKKVQYMQDKEGCVFEATVSGVTAWGAYVVLPDTVEGLIPAKKPLRTGTGERISLTPGERVSVRLYKVDTEERKLWFTLL